MEKFYLSLIFLVVYNKFTDLQDHSAPEYGDSIFYDQEVEMSKPVRNSERFISN